MATKYNGIQKWLRTKRGQTFLNYAYSWGAAVVIAGALFKLTHIAGADIMLFLGMGTEVIVFILAGFEPQESLDAQELAEEAAEDAAIRAQVGSESACRSRNRHHWRQHSIQLHRFQLCQCLSTNQPISGSPTGSKHRPWTTCCQHTVRSSILIGTVSWHGTRNARSHTSIRRAAHRAHRHTPEGSRTKRTTHTRLRGNGEHEPYTHWHQPLLRDAAQERRHTVCHH